MNDSIESGPIKIEKNRTAAPETKKISESKDFTESQVSVSTKQKGFTANLMAASK